MEGCNDLMLAVEIEQDCVRLDVDPQYIVEKALLAVLADTHRGAVRLVRVRVSGEELTRLRLTLSLCMPSSVLYGVFGIACVQRSDGLLHDNYVCVGRTLL